MFSENLPVSTQATFFTYSYITLFKYTHLSPTWPYISIYISIYIHTATLLSFTHFHHLFSMQLHLPYLQLQISIQLHFPCLLHIVNYFTVFLISPFQHTNPRHTTHSSKHSCSLALLALKPLLLIYINLHNFLLCSTSPLTVKLWTILCCIFCAWPILTTQDK